MRRVMTPKTVDELLAEARSRLRRLDPPEAQAAMSAGSALGFSAARVVGAMELSLGAVALADPARLVAGLLAAAFAAFAAYTVRVLASRDAPADCGCFGESSGSVGPGHLVLDLACAGVALAAAIEPPKAIAAILADAPPVGLALAAGVAAPGDGALPPYTPPPSAWGADAGAPRGPAPDPGGRPPGAPPTAPRAPATTAAWTATTSATGSATRTCTGRPRWPAGSSCARTRRRSPTSTATARSRSTTRRARTRPAASTEPSNSGTLEARSP